jgi:adenosylcobyric acid synthase
MIQGTGSNAGKSLITAGLCRVFAQDGFKVAPFKSQNMALNSYITKDGLEMGRAQVVQAEAAGVEPSVDMNPILLKPSGDNMSQVVLRGVAQGDMNAYDYYAYAKRVAPAIHEAYERLAAANDIVMIEGAGSPAEINLKEHDLVNMYVAKMAGAPVLLVADIDRGGVFASIIGTHVLFDDEERRHFKGVLINKFRGDASLLAPGLEMLQERIGVPTLGVIPMAELDIDDEDSLSERMGMRERGGVLVDIAVLYLPHISNFTDFTALGRLPGAHVRYITKASALGSPDLIVVPGSKNTMRDLELIRERGLEDAVLKAAKNGTPVIGICGGYQMLGETLRDPLGAEAGGEMRGMGLLPAATVFGREKVRTRMTGAFLEVPGVLSALSHAPVSGYEIHMGRTVPSGNMDAADPSGNMGRTEPSGNMAAADAGINMHGDATDAWASKPLLRLRDEQTGEVRDDGMVCGNIMGAYLHGLFDAAETGRRLIEALCAAKGTAPPDETAPSYADYKETQYNRLADLIRAHVDMEAVYRILEAGV